MPTIHFFLQGKGGVGKTLLACIFSQYLVAKNYSIMAFDADPVNATFKGYKDLDYVSVIDILRENNPNVIDTNKFDSIYQYLLDDEVPSNIHAIIDNGTSSYLALCNYLFESAGIEILYENGFKVFFHVVVTGGQALVDTLSNLKSLGENFETPLIIWKNYRDGDIGAFVDEVDEKGDHIKVYKKLEDIGTYKALDEAGRIHTVIEFPDYTSASSRETLEAFYTKRMSFTNYLKSSEQVMTKQRIKTFWLRICSEIDFKNQQRPFLGEPAEAESKKHEEPSIANETGEKNSTPAECENNEAEDFAEAESIEEVQTSNDEVETEEY